MNLVIKKIILFLIFIPLKVFATDDLDKKVTITLTNGDVLNGTLIDDKSSTDVKVIDHPQLGELSIGASKIKSFNYDSETSLGYKSEDKTTDINDDSKVATSSLIGSINFGFNGDVTEKSYYKSTDFHLSGDLIYEKGSYTNALSFDWENKEDKYNKAGNLSDSNSLEIDIARDRQIQNRNLKYHFSNKYDYDSDADYGMYNTVTTLGFTKVFTTKDDTFFSISFGPAINFVYGGDDCNIEVDCGATYFARSISANFSKQLTNKLELELENQFTTSYASKPKYGHEFTSTLTFRPSDSSGFNTSFEYENDYKELSEPEVEHSYSLKVGYDF